MRHSIEVAQLESTSRALIRAGHIYILLSSLIHIGLGLYIRVLRRSWRKVVQLLGSLLLIIGTSLLVYSFWAEYPTEHLKRPISRMGLYITLAGMVGHFIANLPYYRRIVKTKED